MLHPQSLWKPNPEGQEKVRLREILPFLFFCLFSFNPKQACIYFYGWMTLSKSRSMCLQKGTRILFAMIKTPRSPRICPPQPPSEPMGYQLGNILLMSHQRQSRGVKEWRMLNVVSLSCGSENQSATLTVKMGGSGLVQNPEFSSFFPSV